MTLCIVTLFMTLDNVNDTMHCDTMHHFNLYNELSEMTLTVILFSKILGIMTLSLMAFKK